VRRILVFCFALALVATPGAGTRADTEGQPFPNVSLTRLDGNGSITVDAFRGRPVLLSFWASWCGPCRVELPELAKLYSELAGDGFVLLTVNVDTLPRAASQFLTRIGVDVPVYRMSQHDLVALRINALPTNILLDNAGDTVMFSTGYEPSVPDEIRRLVRGMGADPEAADGQTAS
jgi:thiol-disulfide isomerase/thioredoxin